MVVWGREWGYGVESRGMWWYGVGSGGMGWVVGVSGWE